MATCVLRTVWRGAFLLPGALGCLFALPETGSGQEEPIVIRMAYMAPQNSPWHDALMLMRERWREASDGRVDLRIIPGGQGGEEDEVLRKMTFGQFQAGGFTVAGLQYINTAVVALAIPHLMDDQEDVARVRAAVGPALEEIFLEEGFVLLHWVDMGWMQFFTPEPDPTPEAITKYTYPEWGENALSRVWRQAGFLPGARLDIADITVGLTTGLVDAINTAPLVVYGYQWFGSLPYMIDLHWAPLSGATLVDRRTWERIPPTLRSELLSIARETGASLRTSLPQWEAEAIQAMESHGLQVIEPPPVVVEEWRQLFMESWDVLRGDIIPEEIFDKALAAVPERSGG